jgi:hypothetical protein
MLIDKQEQQVNLTNFEIVSFIFDEDIKFLYNNYKGL